MCRVAIDYFETIGSGPKDLEDKAHEIVKLIWKSNKIPSGKDKNKVK